MKTFENTAAQGDMYIERIDVLPEGLVDVPPEGGKVIVGHSETGHNHVMVLERPKAGHKPNVVMRKLPDDIMNIFLEVNEPTDLVHERGHDKHETLRFDKGNYRVRRQREHTPEGYRRVED